MKIKPEYKLRSVGGMNIVVTSSGMDFQGVITVNETGGFIWKLLETGCEFDEIVEKLAKECNVNESDIRSDVDEFISLLKGADILE